VLMALVSGTRLGPYEIRALIGAGGMGEVYKAHDTRLDRVVAIKVSKKQFTERFSRETRSIAALNHPNICHLYDVGPDYLVMEYIEGAPLQGPLPLDKAQPIILQLINGIEAAHEKNIAHRDLKPANVKLTPDGVVKILDFGLAKTMEPPPEESTPENSPTISVGATQVGTILGTAAYIAPEQAKGKQADCRSDIWSFGVTVYELLTGKRPFAGETLVETLAAVMNQEPDWTIVPIHARRLLQRCLQKDRKNRLVAIGDARWMIEEPVQSVPSQPRLGRGGWIMSAVLAAALTAMSFLYFRPANRVLKPPVRLDVDLGPDVSLDSGFGPSVILSPDGTRLVYVSKGKLFSRRLDQTGATELIGTEGAYAPFFSPDGKWVAFFTLGKLKKISLEGGPPVVLCDAPVGFGGSWAEDGNIIAALNFDSLARVPSTGGAPSPISAAARGLWPQVLPGGKAVLFTAAGGIDVISLQDQRRKTVQRNGMFGRYLPSGHLLYVNNGVVFAVAFDPEALEARGAPSPVLDQVAYNSSTYGFAELDVSQTGTLLYRSGAAQVTVKWLDTTGKTQELLAKPGSYEFLHLSPDGHRLAVSTDEIWVYDWRRDTMMQLTFNGGRFPVWSPDGRFIVFFKPGEGMFWTRASGAGKPQLLVPSKNPIIPYSFSQDGKRLAYHEIQQASSFDIWTVPLEINSNGIRAGKPEPFLQTSFTEDSPAFSPDGRWLAYNSDESGISHVYIRSFPDNGGKWQLPEGENPIWSRNGRHLFIRNRLQQIMVTHYSVQGDTFVPEKPQIWSEKRLAALNGRTPNYDVSSDGTRIAALMSAETPESQRSQNHVIFVENFFDDLRRKVPTEK